MAKRLYSLSQPQRHTGIETSAIASHIMSPAREIHRRVSRHFAWAPDDEVFQRREHWQDFADAVRREEITRGDCDDHALTCAVLAIEDYGIDPDTVELMFVRVRVGEYHLACRIGESVLCCRERMLVPDYAYSPRWIRGMRMSDKIWRQYSRD